MAGRGGLVELALQRGWINEAQAHGAAQRVALWRTAGQPGRVGEALDFGCQGINTGIFSYEGAPFGGLKASGIGREGSHHGIDEYLEIKYLCIAGIGSGA